MNKSCAFLPLAFLILLVACGVSSDSKADLRPAPPAVRPEAQRPPVTGQVESQSNTTSSPWYQHYDLSEVVVRVGPDTLAWSGEAASRAELTQAPPRPTRLAYSRRLQNLQQVRERLLQENADLAAKLASRTEQPTPGVLGTLRTQLGRLSDQQQLVMTRTQAVEVEHQELLTMLARTTAKADLGAGN